ncbi:hypothetical protein TTHERM_00954280 (macronuclear) [Tetrahymena thermophila SB210]|uniref:Kinase domain protein n=1 Tax=Tetrahymena thermophila (strain SB210) TaxID=312017 RepID=Q23MN6_TETTS|nr:hypothetical protein TTHERM_00954280 [Tetrahymena thermophila SB210]EAR97806.2 hypothetical protein TTHERM_00954280 [Tetrahymena thermophila SB210]|eukprot:XP_001018051.2 hypothetical protein TTHERM_00954280 [Tetrahymena thermophila SB210]
MTDRLQIKQAKESIPRYEVLDDSQTLNLIFDALNQIHHQKDLLINQNLDQFLDVINLNIFVKQFEHLIIEDQQSFLQLLENMNKVKCFKLIVESQSFIEQDSFFKIVQVIQNKEQLEEIELDLNTAIQFNFLEKIGICLQNKSNLNKISIKVQKNIFEEDQFQCIIEQIAKLEQLSSLSLELDFSKLVVNGITILSQNLKCLKNLKSLSLSLKTSDIFLRGFSEFFKILKELNMLDSLKIKVSEPPVFSSEEIDLFIEGFQKLNQIKSLDLSNFFGNVFLDDEIRILDAIKEKQLKSISLHFGLFGKLNEKQKSVIGQFLQKAKQTTQEFELGFSKIAQIDTDFANQISQQIQNFQEIKQLTLIFNGNFSTKGLEFILSSLQNLTSLNTLNLQFSMILSFYNFKQLFNSISQLVNLKKLDLAFDNINFEKSYFNGVIHPFYKLQNLTELTFNFTHSEQVEILEFFFEGLQYLHQLKYLSLDAIFLSRHLNERIFVNLINSLSQITQLKYLKFKIISNPFDDEIILVNMFEQLGYLEKLEHIEFEINTNYTIDIISGFGGWLKKLQLLKYLDITFKNVVSIEELHCLMSYLNLSNLTNLYLKFEKLNSDDVRENILESDFQPLKKLNVLQISSQAQKKQNINLYVLFLKAIQYLQNLQFLDLNLGSCMPIVDQATFYLKQCFNALKNLKELRLVVYFPDNNLKKQGFQDFCISFSYLEELTILSGIFSFPNNISSNIIQSFQSLKNIKELNLKLESYQYSKGNPYIQYAILDNPQQFSKLTKMQLTFNYSQSDYSLSNFLKILSNQRQLTSFLLQVEEKYQLSNEEIEQLGKTLLNLTQLKQFDCYLFSDCQIEEESFKILSNGVSQLQNLHSLSFQTDHYMRIPSLAIDSFYQYVTKLEYLKFLNLELNDNLGLSNFSFDKFIPNSNYIPLLELEFIATKKQKFINILSDFLICTLQRSKNMQKLTISFEGDNYLGSQSIDNLAQCISNLHNLQQIDIEIKAQNYHNVNDENMQKLVQSLNNLKKLHSLEFNFSTSISQSALTFLSIKELLVTQQNINKLSTRVSFDRPITLEKINDFGLFLVGKQISIMELNLNKVDECYALTDIISQQDLKY